MDFLLGWGFDAQRFTKKGFWRQIDEKANELARLTTENEDTLRNLEDAVRRGRELLDQGHDRQDELNELLAKLDEHQAQAKNDVELTKATLKDANEIYKTLKGEILRQT